MLIGLGLGGAEAAATRPKSPEALGLRLAFTPVAMCGFRCEYGGRYLPGPPSVCYERGLNFCGPSRGWGGPDGGRGPGRGEGDEGGYGDEVLTMVATEATAGVVQGPMEVVATAAEVMKTTTSNGRHLWAKQPSKAFPTHASPGLSDRARGVGITGAQWGGYSHVR
jgi:hypothetical protein